MAKDVKVLRGQVRIAVQEILADILTAELVSAIGTQLTKSQEQHNIKHSASMNARLDGIEQICRENLEKSDKRSRAIQGFLVQTAQKELMDHIRNSNITMLAWQEVMAERFGQQDINEFNLAIDTRKVQINERLTKEAEARMAERIAEEQPAVAPVSDQAAQQETEQPSA